MTGCGADCVDSDSPICASKARRIGCSGLIWLRRSNTVRARIKPEALSILVVGKKDDVLPQLARYGDVRLMTAHELDIA